MSVGTNVRQYRTKQNMTQTQLSDKTGIAQENISGYETDTLTPSLTTLKRLADALEVNVWQLLK